MLYFTFIAQTDSVFCQLKQWAYEDVDLAYQAAGAVCNQVLAEIARGEKLATHYNGLAGDVTVATRVRRESNRIYVALLWVGFEGDGPPDGGEGLDQIAFGRLREVATASVTHIGRQMSFQQLGGWPIPNFVRSFPVDHIDSRNVCVKRRPIKQVGITQYLRLKNSPAQDPKMTLEIEVPNDFRVHSRVDCKEAASRHCSSSLLHLLAPDNAPAINSRMGLNAAASQRHFRSDIVLPKPSARSCLDGFGAHRPSPPEVYLAGPESKPSLCNLPPGRFLHSPEVIEAHFS